MTDKKIIKTIERSLQVSGDASVLKLALKLALDLIKRQKAQLADERAKIEICAATISRQNAEIKRLKETNKETPPTDLKNKCGSCVYAVPTVFGKVRTYVECTNQEHVERYCHREITRKRQRTQQACKSYKERVEGTT